MAARRKRYTVDQLVAGLTGMRALAESAAVWEAEALDLARWDLADGVPVSLWTPERGRVTYLSRAALDAHYPPPAVPDDAA